MKLYAGRLLNPIIQTFALEGPSFFPSPYVKLGYFFLLKQKRSHETSRILMMFGGAGAVAKLTAPPKSSESSVTS